MVSSPGARLEGILGCAGPPKGGGQRWDPARAGRARRAEEGPSGRKGRGRRGERDLAWSRYPDERPLPLLPGPAPLDPRGEGRGPPGVPGQICWGKGRGRAVTDPGQEGVGS